MRSLVSEAESSVGLLLFDEPSASLDPRAEHGTSRLFPIPVGSLTPSFADLFERLRALRGNKTMIFSSHRFGSLTRHADLILCVPLSLRRGATDRWFPPIRYMDDSKIQEAGTHEGLLAKDGDYARVWKLQAEAFL